MAYTTNDGVRIHWREQGEGAPLLLIMGLGCASDLWNRTLPELAARYRTILFDNRGIGDSDAPPGPYSIPTMADDAAAVLDAAGIETAHVFGQSMGGMIAQEFALRHPRRVRSLVLGATNCGGQHAVPPAPQVIDVLMARGVTSAEEAFWSLTPFIYDASTSRAAMEEDLCLRSRAFPRRQSYMAQLQAIIMWEAHSRLHSIEVPTLVIHGETDWLIPVGNADILAQEIPNAKLVKLSEASHIFLTDKPREATGIILSFLQEASRESSIET